MFDKWDIRFMDLAKQVSTWSSCLKSTRHVGAVIVRDRRVITTGYNGAPSGIKSCVERNECIRSNLKSGTCIEQCYAVHAEENAILQAAKLGISLEGATLYVTHKPCTQCSKSIINAGIKRVVYIYEYPDSFGDELLKSAGIISERYEGVI